jgi:hypothetical protein
MVVGHMRVLAAPAHDHQTHRRLHLLEAFGKRAMHLTHGQLRRAPGHALTRPLDAPRGRLDGATFVNAARSPRRTSAGNHNQRDGDAAFHPRAVLRRLRAVAVALWLCAAAVAVTHWRGRGDHRTFGALALLWAWSAVAYHAAYFTRINPAAWLFASLFLAEAALLAHESLVARRLRFASRQTIWTRAGWILVA